MPRTFVIDGIEAVVAKNAVAKRMSLRIKTNKAYATIPRAVPYAVGKLFIQQNLDWIRQKMAESKSDWLPESASYKLDKKAAKELIEHKLEEWNYYYKLSWGRVAIRDQSTRWGSASNRGNVNFSWRILYLPAKLQDYIVVHEICHLKHHNHSKEFWALVAVTISDYKQRRSELKQYSL